MARLGRSYTATVVTRAPSSFRVAAQSGTCSAGAASAGAALKVAPASGTALAGFAAAGTETAIVVRAATAPVLITAAAHAAALRYRTQTQQTWIDLGSPQLLSAGAEAGTAAGGVSAAGVAVKVAKVSGVCTAGASAAGAARKVAACGGQAAAGLTASGSETSSATPPTPAPPIVVNRAAVTAATRYRAQTPPRINLEAPQPQLSTAAQAGTAAAGAALYGTAVKVAAVTGRATVGAVGAGTVGSPGARSVSGICTTGTGSRGTSTKRAAIGGAATVGGSSTGAGGKRVGLSAVAAVGLAAAAAGRKRAPVTGRAAAGFVCRGVVGQPATPVPRLLRQGRHAAERRMVDTCTIRRRTGETTDDFSGTVTATYLSPDPYAGKCRVQQHPARAEEQDAGQDYLRLLRLEVQLPISAIGLKVGDVVTLTTSRDPDLLGREFRVRDLAHKTDATSRRVQCIERTGS